jgi:hypothetical protein
MFTNGQLKVTEGHYNFEVYYSVMLTIDAALVVDE